MKKTIIVLDDDRDILDLIALILIEEGFDVIPVIDESDLHRLNIIPDLIILDNWLNGRSGHDICIELKSNKATSNIPVLLISALDDLSRIAESCNADSYINKPFDINHLVDTVNEILVSSKKV